MPRRELLAEFVGTALLLVAVVGSGIMGERLAGGNTAVALLANAIATGAGLYVLINVFGPVSGAHFNPLVSTLARWRRVLSTPRWLGYLVAQLAGGLAGVLLAHAMFALPLGQVSLHARDGWPQWTSEALASFGLLLTIAGFERHRPADTGTGVAFYITGAYWFTSSTSFANPAVTVARACTDTFAGIAPHSVPGFVAAQCGGLLLFTLAWSRLSAR